MLNRGVNGCNAGCDKENGWNEEMRVLQDILSDGGYGRVHWSKGYRISKDMSFGVVGSKTSEDSSIDGKLSWKMQKI